ncbi:MAG: TrkH family potassium uptake protein [Candidatus Bipolaricaulota bacterium]
MNSEKYPFLVFRELGVLVPLVGAMAIFSIPVSFFFEEYFAFWPLLATAGVAFSLGTVLYFPFRNIRGELTLKSSMIIAASAWLLISAIGALPFYLIAINLSPDPELPRTLLHFLDPVNAFFESVAGFTGTGLTMTVNESQLPRTLQWWRSLTQWIGGAGVIVLALTLLTRSGVGSFNLYFSEAREEKTHPSVLSTVRTIWWIILLYTSLSAFALWVAGMPPWEAINHAMTGLTTGGFGVTDESIGSYNSSLIEVVLIPIMLFGAISFTFHYNLLTGRFRELKKDLQTKWLLILSGGGIAVLVVSGFIQGLTFKFFRETSFQFVSAITCTGFQTANIDAWTSTATMLMVIGMVVGGAAGSTAGGIKIVRTVLIAKGIGWQIKRTLSSPNKLLQFSFGSTKMGEEEAASRFLSVATVGILWIVFLFAGVIMLDLSTPENFTIAETLFEVASAQGNVGLTSGITGPDMSQVNKLILSFHMWIGRLEIVPVLFFLRSLLPKPTS